MTGVGRRVRGKNVCRAREAVLAGAYEEFYRAWMDSPAAEDY